MKKLLYLLIIVLFTAIFSSCKKCHTCISECWYAQGYGKFCSRDFQTKNAYELQLKEFGKYLDLTKLSPDTSFNVCSASKATISRIEDSLYICSSN